MLRQGYRLATFMVDPHQFAVTLTVDLERVFGDGQPVCDHQAAASHRASPQFHHHGGGVDHRFQVGVLGLQYHRTELHVAHGYAGQLEPGDTGFFQVLHVDDVVDVPVAVHVAPAYRDVCRVQQGFVGHRFSIAMLPKQGSRLYTTRHSARWRWPHYFPQGEI